jgi:N-acetylneuraminic acid mutarotase
VTNTYSSLPSLPIPRAAGALVAVGDELHYFGGFNISGRTDSNLHFVLNLDNLAAGWQSASPMPLVRNHMAYVNFGNKVYLIAGQTGTDDGLITRSDVQIYDPATDTWSEGASIPLALSHISSSTYVVDDRILVLGGETANGVQSNTVFAYTPATDTWQKLTSLPAPRLSGVSRMINGKIIFTTGGNTNTTWIGTPMA